MEPCGLRVRLFCDKYANFVCEGITIRREKYYG